MFARRRYFLCYPQARLESRAIVRRHKRPSKEDGQVSALIGHVDNVNRILDSFWEPARARFSLCKAAFDVFRTE